MLTLVYQYGSFQPLDWDEDAEQHMRLQVDFWNRLVDIDRDHVSAVEALVRTYPGVDEASDEVAQLQTRVKVAIEDRATIRKKLRKKTAVTPELDAQITEIGVELKKLYAKLKPLRKAAFAELKPQLKTLEIARYEAVKTARRTSGLWWPNYNAVIASYDTASKMARKMGVSLHKRPYSLNGRMTVQIQNGRAVAKMSQGNDVRIQDMPADHPLMRRGAGKNGKLKLLVMTIATKDGEKDEATGLKAPRTRQTVSLPFVMHRPFPESYPGANQGVMINAVQITRRRLGTRKPLWRVNFTLAVPEPPLVERPGIIGIDLGWRMVDGGLRVGTFADTNGDNVGHIILNTEYIKRMEYTFELQSRIDGMVEDIHNYVRSLETGLVMPDDVREMFERVRAIHNIKIGAMSYFVELWSTKMQHQDEITARLLDWRRQVRRTGDELIGLRDRLLRYRREVYRNSAAMLTKQFGAIGITDMDLSEIAASDDLPLVTRRHRVWAAPSELRQAIQNTGRRTGVVCELIAGPSASICHVCGHNNRNKSDRLSLSWTCHGCGARWDQDINHATNIARATAVKLIERLEAPKETTESGGRYRKAKRAAAAKDDDTNAPPA